MIITDIDNASRYRALSNKIATAIDWIIEHSDDKFVKGIYIIPCPDGSEMIAKCEEPALVPREKATLEAHRRYIDIQVPLKGTELMGWAPVNALKHQRQSYDQTNDIVFFGDSAHSILHVRVGQLVIFFPEDAHAPNIGLGNHRKLIIKVPVIND